MKTNTSFEPTQVQGTFPKFGPSIEQMDYSLVPTSFLKRMNEMVQKVSPEQKLRSIIQELEYAEKSNKAQSHKDLLVLVEGIYADLIVFDEMDKFFNAPTPNTY